MSRQGKFLVLDGMDGSGKGTQINLLQKRLGGQGVLFTREPGGTPLAEEIRTMLLRESGPKRTPASDFYLFWAARASHVEDVIAPSRRQGLHVISDRYDSSTFAFQICGEEQRQLGSLFEAVRKVLPPQYFPDRYIFLDLPAEVAHERRRCDTAQEKSRFDQKPLAYHQRVRDGFHEFSHRFGIVNIVDANRDPNVVHADIWKIVSSVLSW